MSVVMSKRLEYKSNFCLHNRHNRGIQAENGTKARSSPPFIYDPSNAPAVVVLETSKDGLLKVKVESDIMAYILYCHYNEFSKIQQTFRVAITWSGMDNTVMFCLTAQGDPARLHLAAQQFLSFYYVVASNLVAAPLSNHMNNITIHQYHRAVHAVRKYYPKAMIKDKVLTNFGGGGSLLKCRWDLQASNSRLACKECN